MTNCNQAKRPVVAAPDGMKQVYLRDPHGYGACFENVRTEQ
jgi:hypothetical protein